MSDLPETESEANPSSRDEDGDGPGTPHNSTEFDEADANHNRRHDLAEFSAFVRSREEGEYTDEELQKRFDALETSLDSSLEMREFLTWSLREALTRSSQRVVDLFKQWDEDNSGSVDRREFHRAIRALGFDVTQAESDDVFDSLDENGSGKVEYKELHAMLRASSGSEGTKANLARGASRISQGDYSKMGKLTAKNVNQNYRSARVSVLPPTVKLELRQDVSMQEQIVEILKENSIKLVSLFNEWDDDANGALSKKELRQGIAALGYEVPKKEVDELFESMNENGDGFIEFDEFKRALSERGAKNATKTKQLEKQRSTLQQPGAASADVASTEGVGAAADQPQVSLQVSPRGDVSPTSPGKPPAPVHAPLSFSEVDGDQDGLMDFGEFSAFIRARESQGEYTEEALRVRFDALDTSGDGYVDIKEFMNHELRMALSRSSERVIDLFKQWDEDGNGKIDKKEFFRALRALGFEVTQAESDDCFTSLDKDRGGKIEYKELNMLLQTAGSLANQRKRELTAERISQGDRSRTAKLTAKNVNTNYKAARLSVLPPTVKLELRPDVSKQEQIVEILKQNSIQLIDLFREWDDDANGGLDKKELRRGIAAIGYEVPKKEVDELFESFNTNEDGAGFKDDFIEFEEFKRVLSERGSKLATRAKLTKQKSELKASSATMSEEDRAAVKMQAIQRGQLTRKGNLKGNLKKPPAHAKGEGQSEGGAAIGAVEATDVQGTAEEGFDPGMRHNWIDFDLSDVTQDRRLDAVEFNSWVRFREEGEHADADLEQRFMSMEIDQNGRIDPHEYVQWSLRDALLRSSGRVVDVFKSWDADRSGNVDKKEFWRAVCALGFDVPQPDVDAVFDTLDGDRSGKLEYKELHAMLRDSQGKDATRRALKRVQAQQADRSRFGKLTAQNVNANYVGPRVACLPETVTLVPGDLTIQEQVFDILKSHSVKLIQLFREWDRDGNGALDKKELRKGIAVLGYAASKKEIDELFDSFDKDAGGYIDFDEFKRVLSEKGIKEAQRAADAAAKAAGKEPPSVRRKRAEQKMREEAEERAAAAEAAEAASGRRGPELSAAAKTTQQQLCTFLGANNAKMMALFRDWDADGNGALDRKEFHRAIGCLGAFFCTKVDIDVLFDLIDESGDGHIDFGEMKRALNAWSSGRAAASPRHAPSGGASLSASLSTPKRVAPSVVIKETLKEVEMVMMGLPEGEDPGELVMTEEHGEHTHTVILLHAEGSAAEAHSRLYRRFGEIGVHCRFVFPRAPQRKLTSVPGGPEVVCWMMPRDTSPPPGDGSMPAQYGYDAMLAAGQLGAQTRRLHALLDREIALLGGDASRVVFGGASQGGMLALHVAMSYRAPLGALLCLRTMLSTDHTTPVGGEHAKTPIFVFAGGRDTICPLHEQRASFSRLSAAGYTVEWHVEPELTHHADCLNEQRYIAYWVARASMAKGAKLSFQAAAVDALRRNLIVNKRPTSPDSPRPGTARGPPSPRLRYRAGSAKSARSRSASPRGRSASPATRVQMISPAVPSASSPQRQISPALPPGSPSLRMGPDGKLMHVNPLTLEPSWRLPLPPKSPGGRKPEWDDRCCTAGEGGLQVAL